MDLLDIFAGSVRTPAAAEGRYYGFLLGKVTNINDPKSLNRVQARIGAQQSGESTDWLLPALPGAIEAKPRVNDPVIVGFIDGDPNRGFYFWHPQTGTQSRPTEAMALGTALVGLINGIVSVLTTMKTDLYTTLGATAFNAHVHSTALGPSGPPTPLFTAVAPTGPGQGKDAAGTVVSANTSVNGAVVLSGDAKVR